LKLARWMGTQVGTQGTEFQFPIPGASIRCSADPDADSVHYAELQLGFQIHLGLNFYPAG